MAGDMPQLRLRHWLMAPLLLLLACAVFSLFLKVLLVGNFDTFAYHWDAPGWLFLGSMLCIASVLGVRRWLLHSGHSTSSIRGYLRLLVLSGLLFVPLFTVQEVLIERCLFDRAHPTYEYLRKLAHASVFHLVFGNACIAALHILELARARERLLMAERAAAEMELRQLRQAVAPHFLFNSLNILQALIERDPAAASAFTRRLAHLYRYILRHRDVELVPLTNELDFVRDYLFLVEQRFGSAWRFTIDPEVEQHAQNLVVPTAIQGLVENAVKHNVARESRPLHLRVSISDERLVVTNDHAPRTPSRADEGLGLEILRARYARLDPREIEVAMSSERFAVSIPLIANLECAALPDGFHSEDGLIQPGKAVAHRRESVVRALTLGKRC